MVRVSLFPFDLRERFPCCCCSFQSVLNTVQDTRSFDVSAAIKVGKWSLLQYHMIKTINILTICMVLGISGLRNMPELVLSSV